MKKLMEQMAEELSAAFEKAGYDPSYGKVTVSNRPDLCEFQCNGAMAGAKAYKKAPFMIADRSSGKSWRKFCVFNGRSSKAGIYKPSCKRRFSG